MAARPREYLIRCNQHVGPLFERLSRRIVMIGASPDTSVGLVELPALGLKDRHGLIANAGSSVRLLHPAVAWQWRQRHARCGYTLRLGGTLQRGATCAGNQDRQGQECNPGQP